MVGGVPTARGGINTLSFFSGRVRWLLICWTFVISAVAYLDRVNISVAGQFIQREYRLSDVQLGWVFSAFVFGYALAQAPAGRIADAFGPRRVIALGTVWWGIFTCLTASVPSGLSHALFLLLAIRLLLGIGEAVVYPAGNRLVASWIPSRERGLANGIIFAGVGIGGGVAPPLITYIILHYGWRFSFWASSLIGLAAGLVWVLLSRDRPENHPWVEAPELNHIRSGLSPALAHGRLPWRTIFSSKDMAAVTFSYFCYGYCAYIFFTWFFIYLNRVRGLDLKASAFYGILPFLAMASCSPLGGFVSDIITSRKGKRVGRCILAAAAIVMAGVFIALGTQAADARLASFVLAAGAGSLYFSQSVFWSITADMGGSSAGAVSGLMNMGNQIAGTITASLTPLLANRFGWTASLLVAAVLCIAGGLVWLLVNPDDRLGVNAESGLPLERAVS